VLVPISTLAPLSTPSAILSFQPDILSPHIPFPNPTPQALCSGVTPFILSQPTPNRKEVDEKGSTWPRPDQAASRKKTPDKETHGSRYICVCVCTRRHRTYVAGARSRGIGWPQARVSVIQNEAGSRTGVCCWPFFLRAILIGFLHASSSEYQMSGTSREALFVGNEEP
jgi:hypothetical protein